MNGRRYPKPLRLSRPAAPATDCPGDVRRSDPYLKLPPNLPLQLTPPRNERELAAVAKYGEASTGEVDPPLEPPDDPSTPPRLNIIKSELVGHPCGYPQQPTPTKRREHVLGIYRLVRPLRGELFVNEPLPPHGQGRANFPPKAGVTK